VKALFFHLFSTKLIIPPFLPSFLRMYVLFHSSIFPSYFPSFSFLNSFIISSFSSLHQPFLLSFQSTAVTTHNHLYLPIIALHFLLTSLYHFCLQFSPSTFRLTFKNPGVTYVGKEINTETRDTKKNREKVHSPSSPRSVLQVISICVTTECRIAMRQNRHHIRGLPYRLMTSGTMEIASMNISICGVMPLNQTPARCILVVSLVAVGWITKTACVASLLVY
jgi:hypothetical protein